MRKETRVIGIDDGPFDKFKKKGNVLVVGTIYRGGNFLDGLVTTKAKVDGTNSTTKIIEMINKSKFKKQIRAIMLDGIAVGGFNVIDLVKLNKKTKKPVIAVIRRKPNVQNVINTLKQIEMHKKVKLIKQLKEPEKIGKIYVQYVGADKEFVKELLKITTTHSFLPEPIRVAHIIATGLVKGESKGRA